jgi:dTDP-4-amino-4,6-dideoxygalactose transaminase
MQSIRRLSHEYGFRIIEDGSHAIGASYLGEPVGGCRFSDITVFSFHPVKIITTSEGGMSLTNEPELADKMRRLRTHGITTNRALMHPRPNGEIWNYQQIDLGYNYRLTDIQAALGLSQLQRLTEFVRLRHEIARRYDEDFLKLPVTIPWQHPDTYSSYHLYVIRIQREACGRTQRQVYDALTAAGIQANLHYIPVHRQPYYEALGFVEGHCPEAELYHRESISIPMFPTLREEDRRHIVTSLNKAIGA